ncbi:MAG TPA: GNAT family N-acetyltransferase [Candidatus Scybalousia intestinigallinarum]|jgi:RimJ/RimL family protein N-acetyltransferase|nr:GNAT family N-acetyltransferase [Candidatus Scybalousia intestinigallinarum]
MIKLDRLYMEQLDRENIKHLQFLKELMKSSNISYLWDLEKTKSEFNNKERSSWIEEYLCFNDSNTPIGYMNLSVPTDGINGRTTSLYYAISEQYRHLGLGSKMVAEMTDYLFTNKMIDCIVGEVEKENIASQKALEKAGMNIAYQDDEWVVYMKSRQKENKMRGI